MCLVSNHPADNDMLWFSGTQLSRSAHCRNGQTLCVYGCVWMPGPGFVSDCCVRIGMLMSSLAVDHIFTNGHVKFTSFFFIIKAQHRHQKFSLFLVCLLLLCTSNKSLFLVFFIKNEKFTLNKNIVFFFTKSNLICFTTRVSTTGFWNWLVNFGPNCVIDVVTIALLK